MTERSVCATTEYTLRDQEQMKAAQRYFAWQARIVRQELGRRVVEVGCGVGNFTRHLLDRELVVALDVEADCVAQLVRNLNHPANLIATAAGCRRPGVCRSFANMPSIRSSA